MSFNESRLLSNSQPSSSHIAVNVSLDPAEDRFDTPHLGQAADATASCCPVKPLAPSQIGSRGNELSVRPTARPCVMICTCAVIRRYEGARNMCLHS